LSFRAGFSHEESAFLLTSRPLGWQNHLVLSLIRLIAWLARTRWGLAFLLALGSFFSLLAIAVHPEAFADATLDGRVPHRVLRGHNHFS